MIDCHCHILPGLDDGSPALDESLAMARRLVAAGFEGVIATPHVIDKEGLRLSRAEIVDQVAALNQALEEAEIPLQVYSGAEYHYDRPLPELVRKFYPPATLAESLYLLIELPVMNWPEYLEYSLLSKAADPPEVRRAIAFSQPVLAHPERYDEIVRDFRQLKRLREAGYLFQVNLGTLLRGGGSPAGRVAQKMAQERMIDFIGTDAHKAADLEQLGPNWRQTVEKILGPARATVVLEHNPGFVLQNRSIERED